MPGPITLPMGGSAPARVKELTYPGKGPDSPTIVAFNTIVKDDWFPSTGIEADFKFAVPVGGNYRVSAEVNWPHYNAPGVGWLNGYSGSGGADTWIRHTRAGATIADNIARVNLGLPDDGLDHWAYLSATTITGMLAGDKIEMICTPGATGVGPSQWNAKIVMTKLKS